MLEDREWLELLDYLLRRLNEIGAVDFAAEVRIAASARVVEVENQLTLAVPASYYRDVGSRATRPPTPKEAVLQAIEALRIRLEMFPEVGQHVAKRLRHRPADIIWKSERQEGQFRSSETNFSASGIILSPQEQDTMSTLLKHLIDLIQQV